MFKCSNIENIIVNTDGEILSHFRFADDIVLVTHYLGEAKTMPSELEAASRKVGLKVNITKINFMTNLVKI